jgi:hypothetical protein
MKIFFRIHKKCRNILRAAPDMGLKLSLVTLDDGNRFSLRNIVLGT